MARSKKRANLFLTICLLLLSGVFFVLSNPTDSDISDTTTSILSEENNGEVYEVIRVVDGDTIRILYKGIEENVRLIGIDTPETVHPSKPVECFGREASAMMKSLVEGKSVTVAFDNTQGSRDKYGRLLLYVWVDNIFVNEFMIIEGYAYEYTYSTPYKYQAEFKHAQKIAESIKKGLWGDICTK